jgi:predicted AAA+ superfamily ATPase
MYVRSQHKTLTGRLKEPRRFIQVVTGPRQVGKTTLVQQVADNLGLLVRFASADEPTLRGAEWIAQQWEAARLEAKGAGRHGSVLILDEIQKVADWSEAVKRLWDADSVKKLPLKVVLLGSAPLLIQRGLTESLAGRFEIIHLAHWTYREMQAAFGWALDQYLFYGGYPGAAPLIKEPARWTRYIKDSLIETTISRDVLLLTRVDKPALLRRLFEMGCAYSGQILSYQKMLGQLQDAGNTTTLAHYLDLLSGAGMIVGLQKFSGGTVRQRGSSPKLQVLNTALMGAQSGITLPEAKKEPGLWGRMVESAIGAHLANAGAAGLCEVFYWRDRNREVDFVVRAGKTITVIEVKSGRKRESLPGIEAFTTTFPRTRPLLVGGDGISIEEFLSRPVEHWVNREKS